MTSSFHEVSFVGGELPASVHSIQVPSQEVNTGCLVAEHVICTTSIYATRIVRQPFCQSVSQSMYQSMTKIDDARFTD